MARAFQDRLDRTPLDDAAGVHHGHVVTHLRNHAEVVCDQHDRGVGAPAEIAEQVQDLCLSGDIERRGRLVGDQQRGVVDQRHRDHHALAHAAGKLVRVGLHPPRGVRDTDLGQHLHGPGARLARGIGEWSLIASSSWPPTDTSGCSEVSGSWKIIAIWPPRIALISFSERSSRFDVVEQSRAGDGGAALGQQRQQRQAADRLPRARLPDDAEDVTSVTDQLT